MRLMFWGRYGVVRRDGWHLTLGGKDERDVKDEMTTNLARVERRQDRCVEGDPSAGCEVSPGSAGLKQGALFRAPGFRRAETFGDTIMLSCVIDGRLKKLYNDVKRFLGEHVSELAY